MITRELLKAEIDYVQDQYLEVLYRLIRSLTQTAALSLPTLTETTTSQHHAHTLSWEAFINQTYGSLADDPIERGDQGQYEIRESLE